MLFLAKSLVVDCKQPGTTLAADSNRWYTLGEGDKPMAKRVTVVFEDALYQEVLRRAGGPRKISEYLSRVIEGAMEGDPDAEGSPAGGAALSADLEMLELQVKGLVSEMATIKARLLTLESKDE
jgi:hypothetical protein